MMTETDQIQQTINPEFLLANIFESSVCFCHDFAWPAFW